MSELEVKLCDFESWWRKGNFYKNCKNTEDNLNEYVVINSRYYVKDDSVGDMLDFVRVFDASNYFDLYKYPVEIYVYYIFNTEEVVEYMSNKGTYEKLFMERLKYYKELLYYKNEVISHMKFKEDELVNKYGVKYFEKLESLEVSDYYNIEYKLELEDPYYGKILTLCLNLNSKIENYWVNTFTINPHRSGNGQNSILTFEKISEKIRNNQRFEYDNIDYYDGILYISYYRDYSASPNTKELNITEFTRNNIADLFEKIYYESLIICKKEFDIYRITTIEGPQILNLNEYQKLILSNIL